MKLRFVRATSAESIPPRGIIPAVTPLRSEPTAHPLQRRCGHTRHVGACSSCQRVAQRRSEMQLAAAVAARETWATRGLPARAA
jgi:hypothetical protein